MKNYLKTIGCVLLATGIIISMLSGCQSKKEGDIPIINQYDVELEERGEDKAYEYNTDDLSFTDTTTGNKISVGMSQEEIEKLIGASEKTDRDLTIYKGVVVKYKDGVSVMMSVSNGQFAGSDDRFRFKTSRGVGIGTPMKDFKKAYGETYTEGKKEKDEETGITLQRASRAVRYFKKDGEKISFVGTTLPNNQEDRTNYYIQDFLFSNTDERVASIRVSLLSESGGGY